MLAALLLHGALLVGFVSCYGRWLDEEAVADVCLFGLVCETVVASFLTQYLHSLDASFFLHLGSILAQPADAALELVFCFDELSGYFLAILTSALVVCFFFLAEYFEYDFSGSAIITLSALFSQAALLYFCAFDLGLILIL
jgi:hypothetical protein